jgi:hypothetical protein
VNYTLDHIKAAFMAAKKGLSEAGFLNYLEFHSQLQDDAPTVRRGRKSRISGPTGFKPTKPKRGNRSKRGVVGDSILKFLSNKGKEGAHVKAIAEATGAKPNNVTAWFYGTGKKNKEVKALGGNTFSYVPKETKN